MTIFGTTRALSSIDKLSNSVRNHIFVILLIGFLGGLLLMGDAPNRDITLLVPFSPDSISYDQGKLFVLSAPKDSGTTLTASTQWETTRYFVLSDTVREGFPKEFLKMFAPGTTIQQVVYGFKFFRYYAKAESLAFKYGDTMTIRKFWGTTEFSNLLKELKSNDAQSLILTVRGWRDSTCTTPYDDPNADNRGLYKLQLHLIPGDNLLYFALNGNKNTAAEYSTRLVNESNPIDSREKRFHNSELEKSCTTCHEGLPSADSGKSMTADCSVCHKAWSTDTLMHSPVEMKECGSCHTWSQEKNSMVVAKGVPDACFDCHAEQKSLIDSARVQHPVAGDCLTCHSPHASSTAAHLLKKNVYDLCTACHDDKKLNHPVGKHPLRFVRTKTGDEISCVSCHTPHGSDNDNLLSVAGGKMMVCAKCH